MILRTFSAMTAAFAVLAGSALAQTPAETPAMTPDIPGKFARAELNPDRPPVGG